MTAPIERWLAGVWFPGPGRSTAQQLAEHALRPLSALVGAAAARRRAAVRRLPAPPVPVVVVGNLVVGGTGKTPLTLALARHLSARGWRVGWIASGHGGSEPGPSTVTADSDPARVGDEPVLAARRLAMPVVAGRRRGAALAHLLHAHPDLTLVLSDDGLSHPTLARTMEIAVFDARGPGNGRLLPAGPLREALDRVREVDLVALNGVDTVPGLPLTAAPALRFDIGLRGIVPWSDWAASARPGGADGTGTSPAADVPAFVREAGAAGRLTALAGIGAPQRVLETLAGLGLHALLLAPGDHVPVTAAQVQAALAPAQAALVMTEKDAVKFPSAALPAASLARCAVLAVEARIDPRIVDRIEECVRGSSTA